MTQGPPGTLAPGTLAPDPSLRIAHIAPVATTIPPQKSGSVELMTSLLTEGLVAHGHDVTLFATGDSLTAARLCSVVEAGWAEDPSIEPKVAECLHISEVFERAAEFDVIHNGFDFLPLTYSSLVRTPVVTTIHGFSSPRIIPVYAKYNGRTTYVAISDADRHPALDYAATIHHGIDTSRSRLHPAPGDYLAYFGRIHPDKGTVSAIETAARAGLPLLIAGIVQDQLYFETQVAPRLGEDVRYLGPIGADEGSAFLGGARALLHLIDFEEPFGYSVVEAMACGTPVIAFARGSMAEIIDDGTTGMLVADVSAAAQAVDRALAFDRAAIRAIAVKRFDVNRMVDRYVAVYEQAIAAAG
jgi:glycosyltransferase involved in cell wall biosynthesis